MSEDIKMIRSYGFATARKWIVVAATFVFIFLLSGVGTGLYFEDYETVYLDVNPSIALVLNRFEIVNDVKYLNDEASDALLEKKLTGRPAEVVLETVIDAYDNAGYFEDAELYISVFSEKNKNTDKLLEKLSEKANNVKEEKNYVVNTGNINKEDKQGSDDNNISPMKYQIIEKILSQYDLYTFEELKEMKMSELKKILK